MSFVPPSNIQRTLQLFMGAALIGTVVSCTSKAILERDDVTVTRDQPASNCQSLGAIDGRVMTVKGTQEEAMENLKEEAVKKGANWVHVESIGAQGTTVRGQAYNCR